MKNVTIITGGAGGMGLATAKLTGPTQHVVISDVNAQKLEGALGQLRALGISCEAAVCDVSKRAAVDALVKQGAAAGKLVSMVHAAGLSPQMADPEVIMRVNALGTVYVSEACLAVASPGFVLVNVASMAAYMMPSLLLPTGTYPLASIDGEKFVRRALRLTKVMPKGLPRTGLSYSISKNFVVWYSKMNAGKFGEKGARILSVSPGSFDTDMGRLEEKSGSAEMLKTAALKRFGKTEEIAELLAFCASDKAGYLTGVDILCDGGVIAGRAA